MSQPKDAGAPASNFLRQIVERDLAEGTYAGRRFAGTPGDAAHHAGAPPDPARIRTRFPPEPNGYLHIGHAKSICLNFGLAQEYGGICHLRFDDTNPEKEEQEYVDAIIDAVHWLGFDWHAPEPGVPEQPTTSHLYFASDYFDFMYRAAEALVEAGLAYVDEQSADEMRASRGDFANAGPRKPVPRRARRQRTSRGLRQMKNGELADGAAVLRAKIDMASPNINLRDPALYRIKRATHHNTGDRWCIYPMYTYAHPIEDALENITHSICTLEFEDQRPFYDWLLDTLCSLGLLAQPRPHQYEFARLNVSYVVTSKRKLKQLVDEKIVDGWDDPRMPTIAGLRRRGYTPESLRLPERARRNEQGGRLDRLREPRAGAARRPRPQGAARDGGARSGAPRAHELGRDLRRRSAPRALPGAGPSAASRARHAPRSCSGPTLWIERDDFAEAPPKGFFRLYPGNRVRLKYGVVVECTGCEKDAAGAVTKVLASVVPDTRSGTPGADAVKVKGTITWLARRRRARRRDPALRPALRRRRSPTPAARTSRRASTPIAAGSSPASSNRRSPRAQPGDRFQFERHGYFVADLVDHRAERPVFNRTTTLRDTWSR